MVVSGVPRATVVLPSKVAQGTIAHRTAVLAGQHSAGADGATAGPACHVQGTNVQ